VPEDLSPHPDSKRYPNHVFTGSQPSNGDERVTHIYEILPAPWVPFTRYDDDLGPIQGRRRSVKNEGQIARLGPDQRVNYEAREGSAIVYTEIEESWSVATDDDGNSLFPIRDRDFYDASRGAVQERRQLFVPTGEEEGTLENINGVITQTSYEAYNEYLSVKIVQTYKVDGPQLVGNATNEDGQLVTVTTQRKAALDYVAPSTTSLKTVEVSREDAESVVERVTERPSVFTGRTFTTERPDPIPEKFRAEIPTTTEQTNVVGTAMRPSLSGDDISKTEQQVNIFEKRVSTTERNNPSLPRNLIQKATDNDRQVATITETLRSGDTAEQPTAKKTIQSESLGAGLYLVTKTEVPEVFSSKTFRITREDLTPLKFKAKQQNIIKEENVEGEVVQPEFEEDNEFEKSEQAVNKFVKRVSTVSRDETTVAESIEEKILTNDGQVGTRVLTLGDGNQAFEPSAKLVDASVEALGDGRTVKTEITVENVFPNKTIRKTKLDLTPEKFKALQVDTVVEENIEGSIAGDSSEIVLGQGEFSKSEQQVTNFIKKISRTFRDATTTSSIKEYVITPQGQLAERSLILTAELQSIQPRAVLIDGSIEALGDGRTVKTEVVVPNVFNQKSLVSERPDLIPPKFRLNKTETTVDTVEAYETFPETPSPLSVEDGEYRKTEQRVTEFTKRTIINKKDDGIFDEIVSADYDDSFDIRIPFTEKITTEVPNSITADVESLGDGKYLVRDYDLEALEEELADFSIEYPTRINLNLPRVLKSIDIQWEEEQQLGEYENQNNLTGEFKSVSLDDRGSVSATLSATPKFNIDIEEIWGQNLIAQTKVFFLKGPITEQSILNKTGAISWPIFKPQSHTITAIGKKIVGSVNSSVSSARQITDETNGNLTSSSGQAEKSISTTPIFINIPPCLSSRIAIDAKVNKPLTIFTTAKITALQPVQRTTTMVLELITEVDEVIEETSPSDVPRSGTYLIDSDVEFFKFGWFLVKATVFDASQLG
jgi:hypothetical protein